MSGAPLFVWGSKHGGKGAENGGAVVGIRTEFFKRHSLRMKLHTDNPSVFVDEALKDSVLAHAGGLKTICQTIHSLMVGTVGDKTISIQVAQERMYHVDRMDTVHLILPLMVGVIGQILDQCAAQGDVQDLVSTADTENGPFQTEKQVDEYKFILVTLGINVTAGGIFLTVVAGIHVRTARNKKSIAIFSEREIHGYHALQSHGGEGSGIIFRSFGFAAKKYTFHHENFLFQ